MRAKTATLAGAALAVLLGAPGPGTAQDDTFEWSGSLAPGRTLDVSSVSGDVRATPASGDVAEVVARKRGDRDDFDDVRIVVEEEADGVAICAIWHARHRERLTCHGRDGDRDHRDDDHDRHDIDVSVDFEVRLPAGVDFDGSTVSGDVDVRDVRSRVEASTVSGHVFVSTSETAWGSTVSGDIELDMGSMDWDDLRLSTVSGDITLWLPEGIGTEVEFESISGDFDSDFPVTVRRRDDRFVGMEFEGTLGDGSRDLTLKTVSGDVRLRRRRGGL